MFKFRSLKKKFCTLFRKPKMHRLRRSPKIFIPIPKHWIVIPYKPLSALIIIILIGCSIFLVLRSDIFLLRQLNFESSVSSNLSVLSNDDLEKYLQSYIAYSMFSFKTKQLESELMEKHPALESVRISKKYPDALTVSWQERCPVLVLKKDSSNWLVDNTGLVYAEAIQSEVQESTIPQLTSFSDQELDTSVRLQGDYVHKVLQIVNLILEEEKVAARHLILESEKVLCIEFEGEWKVFLSLEKDVSEQVNSLLAIRNRCQQAGESCKEIDLRYKLPVIR